MKSNKTPYETLEIDVVKVGVEKGFCISFDDNQSSVNVSGWQQGSFEGN